MSSKRRIDASRAGSRARLNAAVLRTHESEDEFSALREACTRYFQPHTPYERNQLDEFVSARWRLLRLTAIETALFDLQIGRYQPQAANVSQICGTETSFAMAFSPLSDASRALDLLNRHLGRIRRANASLFNSLEARRKKRAHVSQQGPSAINGQCAP